MQLNYCYPNVFLKLNIEMTLSPKPICMHITLKDKTRFVHEKIKH